MFPAPHYNILELYKLVLINLNLNSKLKILFSENDINIEKL